MRGVPWTLGLDGRQLGEGELAGVDSGYERIGDERGDEVLHGWRTLLGWRLM
jgi:hypothetical protein